MIDDEVEESWEESLNSPFSPTASTSGAVQKRLKMAQNNGLDDTFKSKIVESLQDRGTGNEAFGASVSFSLNKFTEDNQEYVKFQIQKVLAESLKCQKDDLPMPNFGID
jgi:hypothetical protein